MSNQTEKKTPRECAGTNCDLEHTGCRNQNICTSTQIKLPEPGVEEVKWTPVSAKHKVIVLTGKETSTFYKYINTKYKTMADKPVDAPEACPGTQSDSAGKSSACEGCPNQKICASGQPKLPDPGIKEVKWRLASVKHKIIVLSGKGGVGKSTFTATLAHGFAQDEEKQVGVLDVDICGPSMAKILGVEGEQVHQSGSGWSPVFVDDNLSLMSVSFLLQSDEDAVIWRGPRKNGLIKQFLKDVDWGDLDFLVIDTPPGTSDEHLSLVQYLSETQIDGAIVVTTPQDVALLDVRKEIDFCKKVKLPIIGVVENMSGFTCPKCQHESQPFPSTSGGGEKLAMELELPFLGKVPLDPRIGRCCDEGKSFLTEYPDTPAAKAYQGVVSGILDYCKKKKTSQENENLIHR